MMRSAGATRVKRKVMRKMTMKEMLYQMRKNGIWNLRMLQAVVGGGLMRFQASW